MGGIVFCYIIRKLHKFKIPSLDGIDKFNTNFMAAKILSAAVIGLECEPIEVEADVSSGNGKFIIVGLPDAAVQESRERVRSAVKNSGFPFPRGNVTINLAPADIRKQGPVYDLPIAVSLLLSHSAKWGENIPDNSLFIGELALNGEVRSVNGIISIALMAREQGFLNLFVPWENAREASLIKGLNIFPVKTLEELANHFAGHKVIAKIDKPYTFENIPEGEMGLDMINVRGQENVKRALEICAAGSHNILMSGPPGSGKTFLARTLPSILPRFSLEEALEVTKIYSVAGLLPPTQPLARKRPFRSPHHTASGVSLVGGGTWPRPGEISLAHRGILFLDEFPEFDRRVLENLRQPLEDGIINISRASGTLQFPARFVLVAAQNPCPCGYSSDPHRNCTCSPMQILNYQKKISGPLLDRIDLHIEVPRIDFEKLTGEAKGENSANIRERVEQARIRQAERFKEEKIIVNSEMSSEQVKKFCKLDDESLDIIRNAVNHLHLSARAYTRVLKLSRTIADLDGSPEILSSHIAEALQYRPRAE